MKAFSHLRVRRWLFPSLIFAIIYLSIDFSLWILARHLHIRSFPREVGDMVRRFHELVLCGAAVVYGLHRSTAYPPASRKGYRDWLRATPWHPGMRLPLGPALLAWQDGFVGIVLLGLAHWHAHVSVWPVLLALCVPFEIGSILALSYAHPWGAYGILFGLAFVARWFQRPDIAAGIAVAILIFTQYALHRSLLGFPWEAEPSDARKAKREGGLEMIPPDTQPLVRTRSALAGSALFGVWLWCWICLDAGDSLSPAEFKAAALLLVAVVLIGVLLRWVVYTGRYHCPVTLFGRIATGRLIIPGYDYVFLPPAVAVPVAGLLPIWLTAAGLPASFVIASTAAVCLLILLIAPPSMRIWQLTGTHRTVGSASGQRGLKA